jgi:protein-tyrosine-phosphatase
MHDYHPAIDAPRILLLCTANQCRSPMAEGLLRRFLADRGVAAVIGSAGLYEGGAPATDQAQAALARRGIDLSAHRSRCMRWAEVDVTGADLVIGMERRHVQAAAALGAEQSRCFTLPELARLAVASEPRRSAEPLAAWATRLSSTRPVAEIDGRGTAADAVADPIGRGDDVYEATVTVLAALLTEVVDRAFCSTAAEVA